MIKYLTLTLSLLLTGCNTPDMQTTSEQGIEVAEFEYDGCSYLYVKRIGSQGYTMILNPKQTDPACKP